MAKKHVIFFLTLILFLLVACKAVPISKGNEALSQGNTAETTPDTPTSAGALSNQPESELDTQESTKNLLDASPNYELYQTSTQCEYRYTIYDNDHRILDMGYHTNPGACNLFYKDDLLVLHCGAGTNSWNERFYDVINGKVSRFFWKPVCTSSRLIAYFEYNQNGEIVLIIQDIFDPTQYYLEVKRDFSDFVIKDFAIGEFISQGTQLQITYWIASTNEPITETIILS